MKTCLIITILNLCVLKLYVHWVHILSRGLNLIKMICILKNSQKVRFWNVNGFVLKAALLRAIIQHLSTAHIVP